MLSFTEWQAERVADGHAHQWTTVLGTTVDRGATYCRHCQTERVS